MRRAAALAVSVAVLVTGCGGGGSGAGSRAALVVVSAPLTAQPWVGTFVRRGAELAASQLAGGPTPVQVVVLDDGGSPQTAAANARKAVAMGAVALVTDGVGSQAVAAVTDPVRLPVFVVFEGGASVVDPVARPTLFRLAPADKYLTRRLADYLASRLVRTPHPGVALLGDDTSYGTEGLSGVRRNLVDVNGVRVTSQQTVPAATSDVTAQVLAARRSGATTLVVWGRAPVVAATLEAVRSSGWQVPVYSGPTGEDPLVRQSLADHPEWVDGFTFVSFRITSEVGGAPFAAYRAAYEEKFGPDRIGVGDVVMPPDWSTYSFDAVKLVAAALRRDRAHVYDALQAVSVTGANGDDRGYGPDDREGVSPDDMYFGVFKDMRFTPVTDDALSTNCPPVPQ